MLVLKTTSRFRKDYRRVKKQGKNMEILADVIDTLLAEKPLPEKYQDHPLTGDYRGFRECHIQPDWLLIYLIDHGQMILTLTRTGSHSDLLDI